MRNDLGDYVKKGKRIAAITSIQREAARLREIMQKLGQAGSNVPPAAGTRLPPMVVPLVLPQSSMAVGFR